MPLTSRTSFHRNNCYCDFSFFFIVIPHMYLPLSNELFNFPCFKLFYTNVILTVYCLKFSFLHWINFSFIYVDACSRRSLIFPAAYYTTVCAHHSSVFCSNINGYLDCLQFLVLLWSVWLWTCWHISSGAHMRGFCWDT